MAFWKWFFVIYAIYFVIFIFGTFSAGIRTEFCICWVSGLIAGLIALPLTVFFIESKRIRNNILRISIFALYLVAVFINLIFFVIVLNIHPSIFFQDLPFSLIDLLSPISPLVAIYPVGKVLINWQKGQIRNSLWKIYFWVFTAFILFASTAMIMEIAKWTFYDYISFVAIPISFLPLYMFIYKKRFFSQRFWQAFFWINIIWNLLEFLYSFDFFRQAISIPYYLRSFNSEPIPLVGWLIFIPLLLPSYYPFYKIAFDKNFFKKNN